MKNRTGKWVLDSGQDIEEDMAPIVLDRYFRHKNHFHDIQAHFLYWDIDQNQDKAGLECFVQDMVDWECFVQDMVDLECFVLDKVGVECSDSDMMQDKNLDILGMILFLRLERPVMETGLILDLLPKDTG